MSRIILSLVLLCLCFFKANAEQSKDLSEIESELRTLERDIAKYNEILENTEDKKSVIEENLKRNENSISDLIKKKKGALSSSTSESLLADSAQKALASSLRSSSPKRERRRRTGTC